MLIFVCYDKRSIIMKKRIHLFIIIGLLLVGFILGSFFDYQIDQGLFNENNAFGLIMASFGVYPCYAGLAFIGGGLLATTMKRKELPLWGKIICYGLSGLSYVMAIYLCGREWPSTNGYNVPKLAPLSYGISALVFAGVYVWAFFTCRKGDAKYQWRVLIAMAVIFTIALLPAGFLIKLVIHRPRYRYAVRLGATEFKNWWEMFPGYKELLGQEVGGHILDKEEFKSFPSGHSGTGMIMAMFFPYATVFFPKLKGKETLLFYIGVAFGLVMMFSRLLVGAHYLTDTCMGSLIVMVVFYIVNEFAARKNLFDEPTNAQEIEPAK